MKRSLNAVIVVTTALLVLLSACAKGGASAPKEPVVNTFATSDSKVNLTAPEGWSEYESTGSNIVLSIENEAAAIEAFMYIDEKEEYTAASYLQEHLSGLKESEKGVTFTTPAALSVNGLAAAFSEYSEQTDEGIDKYLIAAYEVNDTIYELFVVCSADKYEANKESMMTLLNSLKAL